MLEKIRKRQVGDISAGRKFVLIRDLIEQYNGLFYWEVLSQLELNLALVAICVEYQVPFEPAYPSRIALARAMLAAVKKKHNLK